ncbi:MAG: HEPN domain-containing protein [Bacillota bacterium]
MSYLAASECLSTNDPAVEKAAKSLDFHYISSRHPDAFPSGTAADHYDLSDAEEALGWAKTVLAFVEKHL